MKYLLKLSGIYLAFLAQSIIFEKIKIFSCSPDILLSAVIICAVSSDYMKAAALGGFAGLLIDSLCTRITGVNILIYMYLALCVSLAVNEKTQNSPLLMSWVVFISVAALEIVLTVCKAMLGYSSSISFLGTGIFVKGIFGAFFTLLFVIAYQFMVNRIKVRETRKKEEAQ